MPRLLLNGHRVDVDPDALARELAYWWGATTHRHRWRAGVRAKEHQAALALATLVDELGVPTKVLEAVQDELDQGLVLEVAFPKGASHDLEDFPWEYVLTAWRESRDAYPRSVVRRLGQGAAAPAAAHRWEEERDVVLFVESAPGTLAGEYDFATEREIARQLGVNVFPLESPTLEELTETVIHLQPAAVHLAGCDPVQAWVDFLHRSGEPRPPIGGYVLSDGAGGHRYVSAEELAGAVCAAEEKPRLVMCNLYFSGGRTCAELVRHGAAAAIGFQDRVPNADAEQLIAELYRHAGAEERRLVSSFLRALSATKSLATSMVGSGVVLWTREDQRAGFDPVRFARGYDAFEAHVDAPTDDPGELRYRITAPREINYAMLHNQVPLFPELQIVSASDVFERRHQRVEAQAALQVGEQTFTWSSEHVLANRVTDLSRVVRMPLTWHLESLPSERVRSVMSLRLSRGDEVLQLRSFPVDIVPPDSWVDDDANRRWLPSFVLPRDPAVRQIVDGAQRYLEVLADDPSQGFSGYQAVDIEAEDPYRLVDAQVQAIWAVIAQDRAVRYINPPPSYGTLTQRLRTPSGLLRGGRGTCIDLALLFAACLEYVEIFPVVVLLEGHAFVAYWRSDEGYWDFLERQVLTAEGEATFERQGGPPWVFGPSHYAAILSEVHETRQLVPLEATGLSWRGRFWEAVDLGAQNLRSVDEFHSLVDVLYARDHLVTPLPFAEVTQ